VMDKRFVKETIVSEITGLSLQTLRNQRCLNRGIKYLKVGRSVRYDLDDVYKYMFSKKVKTEDCQNN